MVHLTTEGWGLSKGRLGYVVELLALNPAGRRMMARSMCRVTSNAGSNDDAVLADSAVRLKAEQERAASQCAHYFLEHVFASARKG